MRVSRREVTRANYSKVNSFPRSRSLLICGCIYQEILLSNLFIDSSKPRGLKSIKMLCMDSIC